MRRICAVEGCCSGRNADIVKRKKLGVRQVTIFTVPKRTNTLQAWSAAIGKDLSAGDGICEFHFPSNSVIREDKTVLRDGTVHIIPRQRYGLAPNAVPTAIAEQENIEPDPRVAFVLDAPIVPEDQDFVPDIAPEPVDVPVNVDNFTGHVLEASSESSTDVQKNVDPPEKVDDDDDAFDFAGHLMETSDASGSHNSETDGNTQPVVPLDVEEPIPFIVDDVFHHLSQTVLPETWCWAKNRRDEQSIVFAKIDPCSYKLAIRLTLHNDLSVTAHTPDGKVDVELESIVTSIESLDRLFDEMGKTVICCGTGMDQESRDESCPGFMPTTRKGKQMATPRCDFCRQLRLFFCG